MPTSKLNEAIIGVMKEVTYIEKTGWNDHHQYKYASDKDLKSAFQRAMSNHGLTAYPIKIVPLEGGGDRVRVMVTFQLSHTSGESIQVESPGEGVDKGDKAFYKAMTGAQKYVYHLTVHTPTGDDAEATGRGALWTEADQYEFYTKLRDSGVSWEEYDAVMNKNVRWPRPWDLAPDRRQGLINSVCGHEEAITPIDQGGTYGD